MAKSAKLSWFAQIAFIGYSRLLLAEVDSENRPQLTDKEVRILRLVAESQTTPVIVANLILSISTVNYHINNIIYKLDVPNKPAAITNAILMGQI